MNLQQWRNLFLNWVGLMLVEQRCEVESGVVVVVVVVAWPQSSFCRVQGQILKWFKKVVNECE